MTLQAEAVVALVMPLAHERGGAETLFLNLLRYPNPRVRYVCAFLEDGPMVQHAADLGHDVTAIRTSRLLDAVGYVRTVHALTDWIRDKRPDIVVSWMLKAHLYAITAANIASVRTAWFQHGLVKSGVMDHLGAWLPSNAILCCSGYVKQLQDRLAPRALTHICYPGVELFDTPTTTRSAARLRLGLPARGMVVCMVARWERWKGVHVFLAAACLVASAYPDVTFYVVGGSHPLDARYAEELKQAVANSDLHFRFCLVGQRPHGEMSLWHASANVIVQPSIEPEPFGMALVEAMGAGCAVIASEMGGPVEVIRHGTDGLLVPPDNSAVLAMQILHLLKDYEQRTQMSEEAARSARRFSIEAFASRFEEIVNEVCAVGDMEKTVRQDPLWA